MRLLPMLLGLVFPACGYEGTGGLPAPAPIDLARIERPATPNTYLAAPAGFTPAPDRITTTRSDPDLLYTTLKRVILAEDRVFLHAEFPERRQIHVVARTEAANYPDLVMATVTADGNLVLWSRSVYGRKDFGANEARVTGWLADLARALPAN